MKKLNLKVPNSLAIIIAVMLLASVLTYLIPAGAFERVAQGGKTVVVNGSFKHIAQTPVNPITILKYVWPGLEGARSIIWSLLLAGGGLGIILSTGMFQGAAASISRRAKGREWLVVAFLMVVFALLCIPINLNYFIPFAPLGIVLAVAMGYDAIVGISIIMLGGAIGFSCGAMNISNTGTAQMIAELPLFSGMGYRLFCMIPLVIVTIAYTLHYGKKIKEDPSKSLCAGYSAPNMEDFNPDELPQFTKAHIPVAIVTSIGILYMVYVAIFAKLTMAEASYIFMYMGFAGGIAYRMGINDMCKAFLNGVKGMAATGVLIGFAYAISSILKAGNVMDTVVYSLAGTLNSIPKILQAPAMFLMHIIINFFVTSGSGQAAITMPIFVPVADLTHMSRQVAVLAFNFGDGLCNFILPHAAATMGFVGYANIPFTRWLKFIWKLFLIWFIVGSALLIIATMINF
jgi:uncharacterized ion transporter superfamily protein YfcC